MEAKTCIIHNPNVNEEKLTSLRDMNSWKTLLEAAEVRQCSAIIDISKTLKENGIPNISYHRTCRSLFVMPKDLEKIRRKSTNTCTNDTDETRMMPPAKRRCVSETKSRVYSKDICIFNATCGNVRYMPQTRTREKLVRAQQLRCDRKLRNVAKTKNDDAILQVTSREIVAADAYYHGSCYRNYTRGYNEEGKLIEVTECSSHGDDAEASQYKTVCDESLSELFSYIRTELFDNKKYDSISNLSKKLTKLMNARGIQEVEPSTLKNLCRTIETEFGSSAKIHPDGRQLIFVPNSITIQDLVLENRALHKDLYQLKHTDEIRKAIDTASLCIRSEIKEQCKASIWPCHPSDVDTTFPVPALLERFLLGILLGKDRSKNPSGRVKLLVESFSQDIVYAITRGRCKPPKHILLPHAVQSLTGNVEVIATLSKLGHAVSYSHLEENDTALCLQKLASTLNHKAILPSSIQPHVFTNLAWDNIDRIEETLSGKGTSHRVNGIAVQATVYGPQLPKDPLPQVQKLGQRTLSIPEDLDQLTPYFAGARVGPYPLHTLDILDDGCQEAAKLARNKDLLWLVSRLKDNENSVPAWTGFNIKTRNDIDISPDVVGYLPTINAPATELTTVAEILNRSEIIRGTLSLENIVVVMDQALFAKAAEIAWKHPEKYGKIVLRLGAFHTICNALSIVGLRFQDAGLREVIIETGITAEGSLAKVLDGKHYKRAVRVHKCVYEALLRLAWEEFIAWVHDKKSQAKPTIQAFESDIDDLIDDLCQKKFDKMLQSMSVDELSNMWEEFLDHLRYTNGDLSAFWMSYVDLVENVILALIRAAREGNWLLHLSAIRALIPWCFAYDRINYARFLTPYYATMTQLPMEKPDVHENLMKGSFSTQRSSVNPFGRIPIDQTIEVTVNRDTQTAGGTTKFSLKPAAVKRYYMTSEHRSEFLSKMRDLVGTAKSDVNHAELRHPRIEKDESDVSSIVSLVESWVNPFAESQCLMSISTSQVATPEVSNDLMKAHTIGEEAYSCFKTERLESDTKTFNDRMKLNKLKTFTTLCKKKVIKGDGKTVVLKAEKGLFGQIIVKAEHRSISMADVLCHPLGPMPWALATLQGFLTKTKKSSLALALQKNVPVAEYLPEKSSTIIDGMSLVHRVKVGETFKDVASSVLTMALKEGSTSKCIHVVFDTYVEMSIKSCERQQRGECHTVTEPRKIMPSQKVRQWKDFLSDGGNKMSLIEFFVRMWKTEECQEKLDGKVLYVTSGAECYRITKDSFSEVNELHCTQEEADGRIVLHALYACKQQRSPVVIVAEDTDVFIMLLAFAHKFRYPIYFSCGKTKRRLVDIKSIVSTYGTHICKTLIGLHAFTGCDSVSAFAGKGKVRALNMVKDCQEAQAVFRKMGNNWNMTDSMLEDLEKFTCHLYCSNTPTNNINELRYHLFCLKKADIESHQLPPCQDTLRKHAQRANYQASIWKRCLEKTPDIPSPLDHGWKIEKEDEKEVLEVDWMSGLPAPLAVLDLLSCTCRKNKCVLPNCECLNNHFKCTDMCKCKSECSNQTENEGDDDEETEGDDDELFDIFDD